MNEEAILLLYNDLKETYDIGSIDDFKNYLMDDNKKQMFFDEVVKPKYDVDNIETFNEVYGLINPEKKSKVDTPSVAPKQDGELVTEDTSLDTQETPETTEYQPQNILEPIESEDAEFEASLKTSVTPDKIADPEEFVVPEMQYKFGKYGFDFEESTTNLLGTDAMLVKVRGTDKKLKVKLDRLWGKKGTSKELEKFLRENKRTESEVLDLSQAIVQNQRTIQTDEELNATIKLFNQQSERFVYEVDEYSKAKAKLDSIYESNFSNVSKEQIKNNPVLKANYDKWLKQSNQLDLKFKDLEGGIKDFEYKGAKLDKIAGEYTAMKAKQGTWWSGFWNKMMGESGPTFTPTSTGVDLMSYLDEKMIIADDDDASAPKKTRREEYKKDIIKIAKEKGLAPEGLNEDMSLDEVVEALGGDTNDIKSFFSKVFSKETLIRMTGVPSSIVPKKQIKKTNFDIVQDALLDIERKTQKYYEPKVDPSDPEGKRLISARDRAFTDAMSDDPKFRNPFSVTGAEKDNFGNEGMVSAGRRAFDFLKDKSTTEQWIEVQEQGNFLKKGFLGLGGSLPAMLGTSSILGWAQRTAQMYNMSTDYVDREMEKNPMFDKISEAEKTQVKMPIGIATAVLENIGLRNIISQKGLLNSLVSKALRKSNKNTTAKTFQEFIRQDIQSMIGRGALVVTGAGLAEFETGLAQEIASIEIKDVYNASKESKMFETPETFAAYMSQVVEAGLAEAVGGFVMGSIPAVTTAVSGLDVQNLDPKVFEIFENTIKEPTLKSAYISGLKNRIADPSNELDAKEAQKELDLVNKLEGIMTANRIPFDEFNTKQRMEALQLLLQKETLENEIKSSDKILSKPKQKLLDRVNENLEKLTEESIASQEEAETEAEGITQFDSTLDAVQESSTESVVQEESAEGDGEVGQTVPSIEISTLQNTEGTETNIEETTEEEVEPEVKTEKEIDQDEQEDIKEFFKDELDEGVFTNLSINKKGKPEKANKNKARIIKIAKSSAKSIAKLLDKTKIVLHESQEEYTKYTGLKNRGYYDTKSDIIHINLTNASLSTVPHEVFHAVFLNKLKTDAKAREMAIKMVESVKKTLPKTSKLYKEIDAFSKAYTGEEAQFQEEEFIAELIGLMSSQEFKNYKQLKAPAKYAIVEFLKKIAKKFGIKLGSNFGKDDQSVIDFINVLATKTVTGEEITEQDVEILQVEEQGGSGQVGTFNNQGRQAKAPNISDDTRSYAKNTIQKDLTTYAGQNFLTNMYDFTDSGKRDIGGGIVLDLYGGKNYPALMMERTGTKLGEVSNIAAFNTKENAEGFIKNAIEGNANLFAPHAGTKEGSWQFQQNIFEQLVEKLLDNNVITNEELIKSFNSGLKSKDGKKGLRIFNKAYSKAQDEKGSNLPKLKNTNNLNDFIENPKKLVELLDIDNNYSPDLRKVLNDKIAANDKVQEFLGIKNKTQFAELLEDPMNVGSKPFDLMGVIEFDNTTFEAPSRPKKGDADYHPSFAWTVKAKIKAIVQPTYFYQSTDVTDSYTKFNKNEVVVSKKTDVKDSKGNSLEKLYKIALKDTRKYKTNKQGKKVIASGKAPFSGTFEDFQKSKFKSSNVSSSAGSGPKIATVKSEIKEDAPQSRKQVTEVSKSTPIPFSETSYDKMSKAQKIFTENLRKKKYVGVRVVDNLKNKEGSDFKYQYGGLILDSSVDSKQRMDEILIEIAMKEAIENNNKLYLLIKKEVDKYGIDGFTRRLKIKYFTQKLFDDINNLLRKIFKISKDFNIIDTNNINELRRLFSPNIKYVLNENNRNRNKTFIDGVGEVSTISVNEFNQEGIEAYHSLGAYTQGRYTDADIMQYHADMMNANESEEVSGFLSNDYTKERKGKLKIHSTSGAKMGGNIIYSFKNETPIVQLYKWDATSNMDQSGDNSLRFPTKTSRSIRKSESGGKVSASELKNYIKTLKTGRTSYPEGFFPLQKGNIKSVIISNLKKENNYSKYIDILKLTENLNPKLIEKYYKSVVSLLEQTNTLKKGGFYELNENPNIESVLDAIGKAKEQLESIDNFPELKSKALINLRDANNGFDIKYGYMNGDEFFDLSTPQSRKQISEKVKQENEMGKLLNPTRVFVAGIDISDIIFARSYGKSRIINEKIKSLKSDIALAKRLSNTDKIETTRLRDALVKTVDISVSVFKKEAKRLQSKLIKKDGSLNNRASEKIKNLDSKIELLEDVKNTISENLFSPSDLKITDTPESREQKNISELESNIESKYNVTLDLYQNKDFLELDKIIVTEDQRNTGVGSNVMREVIDFANKQGLTITLTPSTSYGATSIDRLKGFYKGLGFVENKGVNKDFTTKQSMLKLPEVKGRESKIPVTIPADLDQQIDELKVRIEAESVLEFEKDKAGKEAYTKKFFDNYQGLKDELKTLELLKEGLVPAYYERVALSEKLNELNKPFMKEVGNEFYPRKGTVKKGKKIKEDKDLGGVFEVDASGYLFRGVSRADFNRVRSTGVIDTDLRGAISEKEGINLAPNASTAFNYLPEGVEGVVMAIKVDKDMDLFMIGADDYVRSAKPIPYQNVKVITTPSIEGRYLEIKDNAVFKLRDYSINEEVQAKPKKEKTIYDIADSYYYNNGYFNAKPAPDLTYLRREMESVPGNYSVEKADSGELYLTENNRIKKNLSRPKGRQQKSIEEIINEGRQNNFRESAIRDFLVRVLNRSAKEVDELMNLDKDFLEVVPKSFTNIKGGIKAGTKLYNRVEAYRKKLVKKNDKLEDSKKLTSTQIVDKTIEYLQKQPEYINEGDKYTVGSKKKGTQETRFRKGFSTQQARMLADYTKTAGVRPTNNMGAKIRKAMAAVRQKVKGARDLQKQKTALRNFIRQSLPKALYTKKDAIDLVNKVNDVNAGNIENLMKEVIEFVNKTNVKSLQAQIKLILNKKYSKVESGRKKPVKISDDIRKRIDFINSIILNDKATPAQIGDALVNLQNRFNELAAEVNQTEDTRSEMVDLELAMMYINTLQLEDTNETKVEQLDQIVQTLKEMIEDGRSQLKEQIREQHLYYLQQFELGYEAITGNKIDMNEPDAFDELNKIKNIFENEKAKRDTQNVIKRFLRSLREGIDRNFFASAEDLFSLMDRLDKLPGEMYGGNLQEMFTERVDEATRLFKGRMMLVEQLIQEHLKEVYGKKWNKQSRQNRLAKDTGIMIQDGVPLSPKSQNQIAYLYNMYKDPANRKSFANPEMYGIKTIPKDATKAEREAIQALNEKNAERVMSEMIALLDSKVKETADWQVNELYPFLYNHYNDAYKKLYRTDLPWNEFYAGTIYREGVDQEEASILDLQNARNIYSTAVGASGTKVRENSNKAIQTMDMMDVLNTYLNQMEYFAAYGEVVRDMSKLFNNKYISDAITKIHGKDVYKYTLAIIDKIASRGTSDSRGNTIVNAMNNVFILSRLAISPVIMIKQLTSFITYANDIGPLNYLKYAAKNKVEMLKVYKEIRDNSVYMKDRQRTSIMRAIETYSDANMKKFVPAGTKDWIVNFAMWTTKFGDRSAIFLGGMPNYSYYKAQFKKKNPGATEQEAIDYAVKLFERDTKRTQQSGDLQDKDYYQTKDPLYRGLNMFLTTPKQYLRKEIVAIRNLNRKLSQFDRKAGKGTVAQNLRTFFMYHVIMPVFFQYVSMGLPGILRDERDDDKLDLLRAAMIGNLNALFIAGDLFQMAGDLFTGKPWAGSNVKTVGLLSIAGSLTEKFAYAAKLKDPAKKAEAYQKAYLELATFTGVPAPTLAKFVDNYGNIGKDGDIGKDILRLLNFSKYQIEGPGKGGRPKKIKTIQELNEEYDKKKAKEQRSIPSSGRIFGPSSSKSYKLF